MAKSTKDEHCSFCGAPKAKTEILVSGLEALICEKCIEQAEHIRAEALGPKAPQTSGGNMSGSKTDFNQFNLLKPAEIKTFGRVYHRSGRREEVFGRSGIQPLQTYQIRKYQEEGR